VLGSEPSLSDHTHILLTLRSCVLVRLIRNHRGTNCGTSKGDLRYRLQRGPEMNENTKLDWGLQFIGFSRSLY